jgi:hypothetical protein
MLEQKFKVPLTGIEYIPVEDCYRITDDAVPKGCDTVAVVSRTGLGPFAEIVSKGRQLKMIAELSMLVSLISSILGLFIMFFMSWKGTMTAVGSAFLYMALGFFITSLFKLITLKRI